MKQSMRKTNGASREPQPARNVSPEEADVLSQASRAAARAQAQALPPTPYISTAVSARRPKTPPKDRKPLNERTLRKPLLAKVPQRKPLPASSTLAQGNIRRANPFTSATGGNPRSRKVEPEGPFENQPVTADSGQEVDSRGLSFPAPDARVDAARVGESKRSCFERTQPPGSREAQATRPHTAPLGKLPGLDRAATESEGVPPSRSSVGFVSKIKGLLNNYKAKFAAKRAVRVEEEKKQAAAAAEFTGGRQSAEVRDPAHFGPFRRMVEESREDNRHKIHPQPVPPSSSSDDPVNATYVTDLSSFRPPSMVPVPEPVAETQTSELTYATAYPPLRNPRPDSQMTTFSQFIAAADRSAKATAPPLPALPTDNTLADLPKGHTRRPSRPQPLHIQTVQAATPQLTRAATITSTTLSQCTACATHFTGNAPLCPACRTASSDDTPPPVPEKDSPRRNPAPTPHILHRRSSASILHGVDLSTLSNTYGPRPSYDAPSAPRLLPPPPSRASSVYPPDDASDAASFRTYDAAPAQATKRTTVVYGDAGNPFVEGARGDGAAREVAGASAEAVPFPRREFGVFAREGGRESVWTLADVEERERAGAWPLRGREASDADSFWEVVYKGPRDSVRNGWRDTAFYGEIESVLGEYAGSPSPRGWKGFEGSK